MTSSITVLAYFSIKVVIFEVIGDQSAVTQAQNAVPDDDCEPTFSTSGLVVSLRRADAAVTAMTHAGFTVRWATGSERIQ